MDRLKAVYHVDADAEAITARAEALALEQSVEVPASAVRSEYVRQHTQGRVLEIAHVEARTWRVTLGLAVATTGFEAGQLMNMLCGNCSLQPDVTLVDIELPSGLLAAFTGPRFGLAGIRDRLQVPRRALTCTALKPQGLDAGQLARLCGTFATAGIDIIKDDHGLADQAYAPFRDRVAACQAALRRLEGEREGRSLYAPALSGGPRQMAEQLEVARGEGVELLLVTPMIMGLPAFQELARDGFDRPVLAHPAFGGVQRIAPALLFGRLFRLFGADAVIFPNAGGRFSYTPQLCRQLVDAARAPWDAVRPALPVAAGGMTLDRIPGIIAEYGRDTMLLIGGNLLGAGPALLERSRQFVAAVHEASVSA